MTLCFMVKCDWLVFSIHKIKGQVARKKMILAKYVWNVMLINNMLIN